MENQNNKVNGFELSPEGENEVSWPKDTFWCEPLGGLFVGSLGVGNDEQGDRSISVLNNGFSSLFKILMIVLNFPLRLAILLFVTVPFFDFLIYKNILFIFYFFGLEPFFDFIYFTSADMFFLKSLTLTVSNTFMFMVVFIASLSWDFSLFYLIKPTKLISSFKDIFRTIFFKIFFSKQVLYISSALAFISLALCFFDGSLFALLFDYQKVGEEFILNDTYNKYSGVFKLAPVITALISSFFFSIIFTLKIFFPKALSLNMDGTNAMGERKASLVSTLLATNNLEIPLDKRVIDE